MSDAIAAAPPLIEALGISKRFGATQALDDVSLTVRPGASHALVGRNGAGKSTLVGLLTGVTAPDAGTIRVGGDPAPRLGDRAAWHARVACVYQRPTLVPGLSVAENLFLNHQPTSRFGRVDWRRMRRRAEEELAAWGMEVDVSEQAGALPVDQRQLVEIARALRQGTRFVILDEPTAQLDSREVERLFMTIHSLQSAGVTFLYISHHLPEIFEVCSDVTILRNGRVADAGPLGARSREMIVAAMVGEQRVASASHGRRTVDGGVRLSVEGLATHDVGPVSFDVAAGEVVGLAGQRASGVHQVASMLVGLLRPDRGTVRLDGRAVKTTNVGDAIAAGISFVPEDRHASGFVAGMSVADNAALGVLPRLARWGFVSERRRRAVARELIGSLQIHAAPHDEVDRLSGGNQQKVVMARALATRPEFLVLVHPTAGVDVASKDALFAAVDAACANGSAALMVSDELDELRRCDRVLVMVGGRVTHDTPAGWQDEQLIAQMEGAA